MQLADNNSQFSRDLLSVIVGLIYYELYCSRRTYTITTIKVKNHAFDGREFILQLKSGIQINTVELSELAVVDPGFGEGGFQNRATPTFD